MQELWKIIIALVVVLFGSWMLFGWVVKRWIISADTKFTELYNRTNTTNIAVDVRKAVCDERHKEKKK